MQTNSFKNYEVIKKFYSSAYIIEKLNIHPFTLKRWEKLKRIPKQYDLDLQNLVNKIYIKNKSLDLVKIKNQGNSCLDQFYTTEKLAEKCFKILNEQLVKLDIDSNEYTFIEPSAGAGNIYNLLPKNRRIGVELVENFEKNNDYIISDFLDYKPIDEQKKYIVFGNPPFGLRGNMALRFINHSASFADVVAFILPPMFDSDGKGTPKNRVRGYKLFYSKSLMLQTFEYPDGTTVKLSVCFQVWTKINLHLLPKKDVKTVNNFIKIYSLSDGNTSRDQRNVKMIGKCDFYLPSTCFGEVKIETTFENLPYSRGYGIVILKDYEQIYNLFLNFDWTNQSMLSVNSSRNFRKSLIENVLIKNNIFDVQTT